MIPVNPLFFSRHLLMAILAFFLGAFATAQSPAPGGPQHPEPGLEGGWDALQPDGSEVAPGIEADIYIVENQDGSYTAHVFITRVGFPPVWAPNEVITIYPVSPGRYVWESAQGGSGIVQWNPYLGHYDNLVTGGRHAGTRRIFVSHDG